MGKPNALTVANSVLGVKYQGGLLVASDMAINYGSCFKFANVSHFVQLTPQILMSASGEFSDFQMLVDDVQALLRQHESQTAGKFLSPAEVFNYVKRIMYAQRSRISPLAINVIISGIQPDNSSFLGSVDLYGTAITDDFIGTQAAKRIQSPALAAVVNLEKEKVLNEMINVFQTITSRITVANRKIEFFDITPTGIQRFEKIIEPNWEIIEE